MNKGFVAALLLSSLAGCSEPTCPSVAFSSLTIQPATPCLTVELPSPHEAPACYWDSITIHNGCSDPLTIESDGPGTQSSTDMREEIPAGASQTHYVTGRESSTKTIEYDITATLGTSTIHILFQGTATAP